MSDNILDSDNNFINHYDDEYLTLIENLRILSKEELVDFISTYWVNLKNEALSNQKDKTNYMVDVFGGIKLTQVNRIRNILYYKVENKE